MASSLYLVTLSVPINVNAIEIELNLSIYCTLGLIITDSLIYIAFITAQAFKQYIDTTKRTVDEVDDYRDDLVLWLGNVWSTTSIRNNGSLLYFPQFKYYFEVRQTHTSVSWNVP